jgi:hypothetical protein
MLAGLIQSRGDANDGPPGNKAIWRYWTASIVITAPDTIRRADRSLCRARLPYWKATGLWRPASLSAFGRPAEAVPATGAVTVMPAILTSLADALGKTGQALEGFKHLKVAARQIQATLERWTQSDMNRVRGDLLIAGGDPVRWNRASRRPIPLRVCRAQNCGATRLHKPSSPTPRDQGKSTEPRDLLAPIYDWFTEGFDTPVLRDARRRLISWGDAH